MEIIEVSESDNTMALKAKGRQRCKITNQTVNISFRMGKVCVKILPEIDVDGPLKDYKIPSLNKCRMPEKNIENIIYNSKYRKMDAAQLNFPLWVYNQYEPYILSKKIQIGLEAYSIGDCVPTDPLKLSYWFMQNFQLNHNERMEILKLDSAVQRLRLELYYLKLVRTCFCTININYVIVGASKL